MITVRRERAPAWPLVLLATLAGGCTPAEKEFGVNRLSDIGGACQSTDHCGTGLVCDAGACRVADGDGCYGDDDCTSRYCVDRVCVGRGNTPTGGLCNDTKDCKVNDTCENGICKRVDGQTCTDTAECASGYCIGDLCTNRGNASTGDACTVDEDCLVTHACVSEVCKLNDGESCFGFTGSDCLSGICFGDACIARGDVGTGGPCIDTGDCQLGNICVVDTCLLDDGGMCTLRTECASGYCVDGTCCATACEGQCDGTCDASGVCQPDVDGTTCDDGEACTVNDACGNGVCQGDADVVCIGSALMTDDSLGSGLEGLYISGWGSAYAIAWGDYDNDGHQDVFFGGDGTNDSNGDDRWVGQLYHNEGNGTFAYAGPDVKGDRAAFWGDPDNDGDLDLFTTAGLKTGGVTTSSSRLYVNDGATPTPSFSLEETTIGLDGAANLGTSAWIDVNADGYLDLWYPNGGTAAGDPPNEIRVNDAQPTLGFTTDADAGLQTNWSNGEMSVVGDIDNDGDIDIWYNDDFDGSLYLNDGSGNFTEGSNSAGLAYDMMQGTKRQQPYYAPIFGDYNNDGWLDIFLSHPETQKNRLYTNTTAQNAGVLTFRLEATAAFLNEDLFHTRGAAWGDFDNDGDLDLLLGNEKSDPDSTTNGKLGQANALYLNNGAAGFVDVAPALGLDSETRRTFSVSFADYDNDGDLDVIFANQSRANSAWVNGLNDTKYLKVKVVGKGAGGASKDGIGTRIELWDATATALLAIREVSGGEGYGSQPPLIAHFGLAAAWGGGRGTYVVRAKFIAGPLADRVQERAGVVPVNESITIGTTTLTQTIEIVQP